MKIGTLTLCAVASSILACGGQQALAPVDTTPATEPAMIGVRAAWVSYLGAKDAPSQATRSKEEAADRARMLSDMARVAGEDFQALVRTYSDRRPLGDPGAAGVPLERGNGLFPSQVEDAAFLLEEGEVTAPQEVPEGFVVIKRTVTPSSGPRQIAAKHVLISYSGAQGVGDQVERSKDEARALAEKVLALTREEGAEWEAIAQEYTDEPGARQGGDLGVFGHGQMVPPFERAAFALKVGEISAVVESPFGFHVIKRYR